MMMGERSAKKRERIATASFIVWLGWLGLFCGFEFAALARKTPWTTLSEFTWDVEVKPFFRWTVMLGLAVLQAHLVSKWPR